MRVQGVGTMSRTWPHCDFCGITAERLSRTALDSGYDRLTGGDRPLFACPKCTRARRCQESRAAAGDPLAPPGGDQRTAPGARPAEDGGGEGGDHPQIIPP